MASFVVACGGEGSSEPDPPSTAWTVDKTILTNADYAGKAGVIADVTVLKLNGSGYRMFIGGTPDDVGSGSAISTDGVSFTLETSSRVPCPLPGTQGLCFYHPHVIRLSDGRVRLFMGLPNDNQGYAAGIYSLTSDDEGVTFTLDTGARVTAAAAGLTGVSGPSIVKMTTGGWRMYFSDAILPGTVGNPKVASAFSTDLVGWTVDPGFRIGPGATLTGSAEHPGSIANDDGSITLIYFRNSTLSMLTATPANGLTFSTEVSTGFGSSTSFGGANDPFLMRLANGDVRMYYNWGDNNSGAVYTAHRVAFTGQ